MTKKIIIIVALLSLATLTQATMATLMSVPCLVIRSIYEAFRTIAPAIITITFIYGAARYVFAADDPGGRKQGKHMMIHAIIAVCIIAVISALVSLFGLTGKMCGITI